jgi:hypothetical protein
MYSMATIETLSASEGLSGFIKVWQTDPNTGETSLLVDKKNMILKGGANIIARALGGDPTAKIWGMYIGYCNTDGVFQSPPIDIDYSSPFLNYTGDFGYLREPLTFNPNYMYSAGYEENENTVLFSTMITTASKAGGADFNAYSQIYEVALVSVADLANPGKDVVFSRTNFNPVLYNSNYNFTITWGVRILVPVP